MKIILSPSKTQDFQKPFDGPMTTPLFTAESIRLNNRLKRMSKKAIADMMQIKDNLLDDSISMIKEFPAGKPKQAVAAYTGLVFKYFDLSAYDETAFNYLNNHLFILSAKYGALRPLDGIHPYRLDMKMKPSGLSLYDYWQKEMDQLFTSEDLIIDLASNEFSKMVSGNKITVGFRTLQDGKYKNLATYSKMARGMLLHQMVLNQTNTIDALKALTFDDYSYSSALSNEKTIIFSKN